MIVVKEEPTLMATLVVLFTSDVIQPVSDKGTNVTRSTVECNSVLAPCRSPLPSYVRELHKKWSQVFYKVWPKDLISCLCSNATWIRVGKFKKEKKSSFHPGWFTFIFKGSSQFLLMYKWMMYKLRTFVSLHVKSDGHPRCQEMGQLEPEEQFVEQYGTILWTFAPKVNWIETPRCYLQQQTWLQRATRATGPLPDLPTQSNLQPTKWNK